MRKHLIIALAVAGLAFTACGKKASYRTGKFGENKTAEAGADPNQVQDPIVLKAEEIASSDNGHMTADVDASKALLENILGISIKLETVTADVGAAGSFSSSIVKVLIISKSDNNNCTPIEKKTKQIANEQIASGIKIPGVGSLKCVDAECLSLSLLVQTSREASPGSSEPATIVEASVAIVLTKGADGVYTPVKSTSTTVASIESAEQGAAICRGDVKEADQIEFDATHPISSGIIEGEQLPVDAEVPVLDQPAASTVVVKTGAELRAERNAEIAKLRVRISSLQTQNVEMNKQVLSSTTDAGTKQTLRDQVAANEKAIVQLNSQIAGLQMYMPNN